MTDAQFTPVGNTYTLVEYVTAGGYSMATYVATNVQNFPDPNPDNASVLNVDAIFSSQVTDAGVSLSAWTGVNAVEAQAMGAHRSASGSDPLIVTESDYALQTATGSVDPQWTWNFDPNAPSTWLATVLALNPPMHLAFTVPPSTTLPLVAMRPGVQVTV